MTVETSWADAWEDAHAEREKINKLFSENDTPRRYCRCCSKFTGLSHCVPDSLDLDQFGRPLKLRCEELNADYACVFYHDIMLVPWYWRWVIRINVFLNTCDSGL